MKAARRAKVKEKLDKKVEQLKGKIKKLEEDLFEKKEELLGLCYIQQVGDLADYLRNTKGEA